MNFGLAVSADSTRLPSLRATSESGGSCSLRLTIADWAPAVERPSSQSESSMMRRKSATSALLNTSGMQISIPPASPSCGELVPCGQHDIGGAAGCLQHEWRRALIQRIVVALVKDVVHVQLDLPV